MKMPKSEITYVFGAGASVDSMPLVKNFPERFSYFIRVLKYCSFDNHFINTCVQFLNEVEKHQSFDTFFKKLFHKNRQDQARIYKKLLLIYFYFEHKVNIKEEKNFFKVHRPEKLLTELGKVGVVDKRYDSLLASLLVPVNTKCEFFKKTNFITWNYDINLTQAILNFTGIRESVFGFQEECMTNKFYDSEQFSITRLNGEICHPELETNETLSFSDLIGKIGYFIDWFRNGSREINVYASKLKFAWESDFNTDEHIKFAQSCISNSSHIIFIGYSFPLYNRLVDNAIFHRTKLNGKSIIIQNSDPLLKQTFANAFGIQNFPVTKEFQVDIQQINECNSFYVPSDVFAF